MAVALDPTAIAARLNEIAGDSGLDPADRVQALRRQRDELVGYQESDSGIPDADLTTLIGQCDGYIGSLELMREAQAMEGVFDGALARENAEIRDVLLEKGIATPEQLDTAGWPSHDDLDKATEDGTLEEAFGLGALHGESFNLKVHRDHGKFSKMDVAGAPKAAAADVAKAALAPKIAKRGTRAAEPLKPFAPPAVPHPPVPQAPSLPAAPEPPAEPEWHDVGGDVNKAADLLAQGKHVRLAEKHEVSMLLDELAKRVQAAKDSGASAPNFDLCKITVPNTNLFCAESKGVPRIKMPQLSGVPLPGTPADKLPKSDKGSVDLAPAFHQWLIDQGHHVEDDTVPASHMKATQIELNGGKVAGMVKSLEAGKTLGKPDEKTFVSNDDYIVDGHHRWAAQVGHDLADGQLGDIQMPVRRVDMPITELLDKANQFTKEMGLPSRGVEDGGHDPELPQGGHHYFNTDEEALQKKYGEGSHTLEDVPLDQITPIRARPEGIANAKPHMIKARKGEGPKRDPITVIRHPDGSHTVHDGNSTFAIAQQAGWSSIPAMVVNSEEAGQHIEKTMKAEKAAAKERERIDSTVKHMFKPGEEKPAEQHFASLDDLYAAAEEDAPAFEELLTQGLPEELGAVVPSYDEALANAAEHPETPQVLMGPIKKRARAEEKVDAEYDGDHNKLADVIRATILVPRADGMADALEAVRKRAEAKGWKVRGAKDKFSTTGPPPPTVRGPTSAGYSDTKIALVSPNGVAAELQFNTQQMFLAKEGEGHKLYEKQRSLEAEIKTRERAAQPGAAGVPLSPGTTGGPTVEEAAELDRLRAQQTALYSAAREAAYA